MPLLTPSFASPRNFLTLHIQKDRLNVTPSPLIEQLLNQSPKKKKPKRHPIHQNKNEEELIFTGEEVVDEELSQVLDDIYAKAGESYSATASPERTSPVKRSMPGTSGVYSKKKKKLDGERVGIPSAMALSSSGLKMKEDGTAESDKDKKEDLQHELGQVLSDIEGIISSKPEENYMSPTHMSFGPSTSKVAKTPKTSNPRRQGNASKTPKSRGPRTSKTNLLKLGKAGHMQIPKLEQGVKGKAPVGKTLLSMETLHEKLRLAGTTVTLPAGTEVTKLGKVPKISAHAKELKSIAPKPVAIAPKVTSTDLTKRKETADVPGILLPVSSSVVVQYRSPPREENRVMKPKMPRQRTPNFDKKIIPSRSVVISDIPKIISQSNLQVAADKFRSLPENFNKASADEIRKGINPLRIVRLQNSPDTIFRIIAKSHTANIYTYGTRPITYVSFNSKQSVPHTCVLLSPSSQSGATSFIAVLPFCNSASSFTNSRSFIPTIAFKKPLTTFTATDSTHTSFIIGQ
ncbi:hypothetical protein C7M84_013915 [Penaeus vannamei]|uniref:Uncharacterized protein n=1 Tax=Penaeus vannamei TaxID=6689 RepID=A0A423SUW6_PENVA|nr:hypothetical protein C7M84_013915 [Penaeus vannamei]